MSFILKGKEKSKNFQKSNSIFVWRMEETELENWNNYSARLDHNNLLYPPKLVFVHSEIHGKSAMFPQKHRQPNIRCNEYGLVVTFLFLLNYDCFDDLFG